MNRRLLAVSIVCLAPIFLACTEQKPADKPAPPKAPAIAAAPKPTDGASVPSASGKSDPDCVGPIDTGVPETLKLGTRTAEMSGYHLVLQGPPDADDQAVVGVLANVNEASGENFFNLQKYLAFFKDGQAELIVVAGDSGEDRASIRAVLKAIADFGLPVLAIAGNREAKVDFVDAVNDVRKERPNLVNGNRVRLVDWDDVDLATLPGYHDPRYIHPGAEGCQYFKQDLDALAKVVAAAKDPVFLVAHGGPKGETPTGIDVLADDKKNVGDPNLAAFLVATKVPFGVFPNIKEAGGRAVGDVAGTKMIPENAASGTLYLNPGSADALPWTLNDGTTAQGLAALVTVKGKTASYKLFRAPPLSDADKAAAAKLVPAPAPAPEEATAKTE